MFLEVTNASFVKAKANCEISGFGKGVGRGKNWGDSDRRENLSLMKAMRYPAKVPE